MSVIGRPDLADDPELAHNDGRVARAAELDQSIEAWTSERSHDAVLAAIDAAGVPVGRIYSVADIATDPQYLAREMIVDAPASYGGSIKVPGIVPKLSATPGRIRSAAPKLGEHTHTVVAEGWPAQSPATRLEAAE
jgi:formyl-CoA transferase